jgi:hypothetical protein
VLTIQYVEAYLSDAVVHVVVTCNNFNVWTDGFKYMNAANTGLLMMQVTVYNGATPYVLNSDYKQVFVRSIATTTY